MAQMTLDEAIKHAEDVASECSACAEEHKQLALWLRELKTLRVLADRSTIPCALCGHYPAEHTSEGIRYRPFAICFKWRDPDDAEPEML